MLVFSTGFTVSVLNSGEYNPFCVRSIFILWAVNYIIRWTAQFPAYPRLLFGFCREGLTGRLGVVDSSANAYRGLKIIFNLS